RNAESAVKRAKSQGERYLFYTAQMTERVAEKLALENKLRRALERDEFILHYQPKVDLERRSIVGVEALIRWQSPELGLVPPLPVQSLKTDRSFITAMDKDANAMTLVSTIVSLAHSLHLTVVAEGVETEEQAKILRLLRCDEMQGYLFSKPLPMAALVELLRKSS